MIDLAAVHTPDETAKPLTVSELNHVVRDFLAHHFPCVYIKGEISNLVKPRSGHLYFSLKDAGAQVRCAFFRHKQLTNMPLSDGMHVTVKASVTLYPNRGDYQLMIDTVQPDGEGALQQAFVALKRALAQKGYFDVAHKKALPTYNQTVGIITSKTGAALQDCLSVIARRAPTTNVIIYHSDVQGAQAPSMLQRAIILANQEKRADVLLLTRGGGSMEDLWAFNDEGLAQAMFQSVLPIVSAIGHEIDMTIADFVADKRAPTPSAGAELITVDQHALMQHLAQLKQRLFQRIQHLLAIKKQTLQTSQQRLVHPAQHIHQQAQHLDALEQRMHHALIKICQAYRYRYLLRQQRLIQANPTRQLAQAKTAIKTRYQQLVLTMDQHINRNKEALTQQAIALNAHNPLTVLSRGFSIVQDEHGRVIRDSAEVDLQQEVAILLHKGALECSVTNKRRRH